MQLVKGRACIPVRIILLALSAGNVLVLDTSEGMKLPETWLGQGESICKAAERLATEVAGSPRSLRIVSVVWFSEVDRPEYHIAFAVEGFIESKINLPHNANFIKLDEASRVLSDEVHRKLVETIIVFKPRPLLVCT